MRYFILSLLIGLFSSLAFADFHVYNSDSERDRGDRNKESNYRYDCSFARGKKKQRSRCFVYGSFSKDDKEWGRGEHFRDNNENDGHDRHDRNSRDEAKLTVECRDGFSLFDRDAQITSNRGDWSIKGRDNGDRAKLEIEDFDWREGNFTAFLRTDNSSSQEYIGSCRIEKSRYDRRERDDRDGDDSWDREGGNNGNRDNNNGNRDNNNGNRDNNNGNNGH